MFKCFELTGNICKKLNSIFLLQRPHFFMNNDLLLAPSGSGAGGSASGLGPEGRRFESCLPDVIIAPS